MAAFTWSDPIYKTDTRHIVWQCSLLLDVVITSYQGDVRKLKTKKPLDKSDRVASMLVLLVLNKPPGGTPVSNYNGLRIKEIQKAATSAPWLPEHEDLTVERT